MPSVLILTGAAVGWQDPAAVAVAGAVGRRLGPDQVRVVGALELGHATWDHRIEQGVARTRLHFADWVVDTREVGAALNLVRSLPSQGLMGASVADRAYADTEWQALYVSFLEGLGGRAINGVDGQGPLGVWSQERWAALAHRCELSTSSSSIAVGAKLLAGRPGPGQHAVEGESDESWWLCVVGQQVLWAQGLAEWGLEEWGLEELSDRCRALAELSGCEVLGLQFVGRSEPRLVRVDPFPQVTGEVAEAVAARLCELAA